MVNINEQKIASQIVNIPKILFVDKNKRYKISEWIDGVDIVYVFTIPEVFIKCGELLGKLNLIKDEKTGMCLSNVDFSSSNIIWTVDKKIYLIDMGKLRWTKSPEVTVVQVLLKRIKAKDKIDSFLEGYLKFGPIEKIIEICEQKNWKWK